MCRDFMLCAALALITTRSHVEASPVYDAGSCSDDNLDKCGRGATEAALLQKKAWRHESDSSTQGQDGYYVYVPKEVPKEKLVESMDSAMSGMMLVEAKKTDDHKAPEKFDKASSESGIGGRASMDDDGYMQVAETKDPKEMVAYTLRLISDMGLHIRNEGGVNGLVPFFDGHNEAAVQTFGKLKAEIQRNANKKNSWVAADKKTSSVLQKSASRAAHVSGDSVPLSEQGYIQLVQQEDSTEMSKFVRRITADMGLHIQDEGGLSGFSPWYSGERDAQTLARLKEEITLTSNNASAWVVSPSKMKPKPL